MFSSGRCCLAANLEYTVTGGSGRDVPGLSSELAKSGEGPGDL